MTDDDTTQIQEPDQPPEPEQRRMTRPRDDRVFAGVCGGLGRYFNVDPVLFRVAAVALIFFGGAGLLLYIAAVLLIPNEGEERPESRRRRDRALAVIGVVLLVVAAGSIFSHGVFHAGWAFGPFVFIALAALGRVVARVRRAPARRRPRRAPLGWPRHRRPDHLHRACARRRLAGGRGRRHGRRHRGDRRRRDPRGRRTRGLRPLARAPGALPRASRRVRVRGQHRPARRRRRQAVRAGLGGPGARQLPRSAPAASWSTCATPSSRQATVRSSCGWAWARRT